MVPYFPSPPSPPSSLGFEGEGTGLFVAVVPVFAGVSVTVGEDEPFSVSLASPQAVRGTSKPIMSKTLMDCFEFIQFAFHCQSRFTGILLAKPLRLLARHALRFCAVKT
jgi:hypothetical protein